MRRTVQLTRARIWTAYGVAIAADASQWLLGPIGMAFPDEAVDVVAAGVISWAIGFHPLFLPAFILEFLPIADLLPTWTGCVALVIALRKRQGLVEPPPPGSGSVIDV
ncbi:MAG TPA: hypothetical protein VHZ73_10545 [Vicinamibacterales bacterium]|nr:hypothetical protein [Vicinamibacterales bacterium]